MCPAVRGVRYDPDLFERETITRLAGHLTHVLDTLTTAETLDEIDIRTDAERRPDRHLERHERESPR